MDRLEGCSGWGQPEVVGGIPAAVGWKVAWEQGLNCSRRGGRWLADLPCFVFFCSLLISWSDHRCLGVAVTCVAQVFVYRSQHTKGRGAVLKGKAEEFVWVTRAEVPEYVKDQEYGGLLDQIL